MNHIVDLALIAIIIIIGFRNAGKLIESESKRIETIITKNADEIKDLIFWPDDETK